MVRETRHLWVGNLPENIREDRIREHFKRYGRVQSVKLLPRCAEEKTGEITMACTVAFMDIKSAAKAHNADLKIDDRTLNTEYYEPAAIPSATATSPQNSTSPYSSTSPAATRFPNGHGSSDEHVPTSFTDRYYERPSPAAGASASASVRSASSSSSTSSTAASSAYHHRRDRQPYRNGPYQPASSAAAAVTVDARHTPSGKAAAGGGQGGAAVSGTWSSYDSSIRYNSSQADTGYSTIPSDNSERRNSDQSSKKKTKSRSGSRSPSPSGSTSSRSPSRSRSRSSSTSSSSSASRDSSSTASPKSRRPPPSSTAAGTVHSDDRRPLAICVRNLPARSSDTSLKDGLYHEYKKHGKVTWVKVVGQDAERYAIVCFKKPEDVEKALEVSYDKLFFGCKIEVAPYQGYDVEDNDLRPYEAEIDEFHPKATRTLFIGNLEKDVTASDLRKHFDQFGEIIEIDIKKQGAVSSYAFCQYSDITSVVKAIRKMDGEHLGNNRIKLGFGKSMPYNCVWIDGVNENVNDKYLRMQFEPFGVINKVHIDREKGQALVFYEQVLNAQTAVSKMRGFTLKNTKIQVDFASRECQESFFERLEKQGTVLDRGAAFEDRRDSTTRSFETSSVSRFSRYEAAPRPRTSSYSSRSGLVASVAMQSPGTPGSVTPRARSRRHDYYDPAIEYTERHHSRGYDEYSQGSAASHEDVYEDYGLYDSPTHLDALDTRSLHSVADSVIPFPPPDIRNLQKERVHLLEQLEECPSSGDELMSPKKRLKLDLLDSAITSDVIIEANRDHRKVMEVRRLSDAPSSLLKQQHHSRRPSVDSSSSSGGKHTHPRHDAYGTHGSRKRRKTGVATDNTRPPPHHYEHHSGSESAGGSRPGTPLCDERPENCQPSEPRRAPREREGPLTLPLPRFAAQIMNRGSVSVAGIKGQKDVNSSPPPAMSPRRMSHTRPPSPVSAPQPPPASPPPRPPSLGSSSSDSGGGCSDGPSLEERIRSLDEKYERWSGSRALSAAGGDALALLDANLERFRQRHKLLDLDLKEVQPSEIVKSVMAKRSVFDEDLKRLENAGEKYEPREFGVFRSCLVTTTASSVVVSMSVSTPPALKLTPLTTSVAQQAISKAPGLLSPRSTGAALPAAKGLQYPFPTHPPVLMSPVPSHPQTPPISTTSVTLSTATPVSTTVQTATTTSRGASHGDNRLKPCASVPSDTRTSSKVNVNRSTTCKISEKTNSNIPCSVSEEKVNKSMREIKSSDKTSEKVSCRRDSNSNSPRADIKTRRNSDTSARRIEDVERIDGSHKERAQSEERKRERLEKIRIENEKLEKDRFEKQRLDNERLEKEKQEKERVEKERLEKERLEREKEMEKQRLEKERLEKERILKEQLERERFEKEKARLEKERLEKDQVEKMQREKERLERERIEKETRLEKEKERLEQERLERERKERERREREEKEKREREEKERHAKEELDRRERDERERRERDERERKGREDFERKEREEKERRLEEERLGKERLEKDRHDKDKSERERKREDERSRYKEDNHDRRKDDHKHREIHSEIKHRDNNIEKHFYDKNTKESSKEEKNNRESHEINRRDSHESKSSHEKSKHHIEKDFEKRKESIKENRDNNVHDKYKGDGNNRGIIESRHMSIDLDKNKCYDGKQDTSKRKERNNSLPAALGSKHRLSAHDSLECPEENKKSKISHDYKKISERRDSKDSSRLEDKSKSSKYKNNINKTHDKHNTSKDDEKRKEKEKEREERHKKHKLEKQKSKSKSREKDTRESPTGPSPLTDKDFLARLDLRLNEDIEKHKKDKRKESTIEDKEVKEKVFEEKGKKQQSTEKLNSEKNSKIEHVSKANDEKKKRDRTRKPNSSESDSDEPKKHSIFDIVDDEPAYISMYDKVKARSCKNMAKQEEEKRQEKIKAKFSQLKQSRAKREEKKRSTSWDEDSDLEKDLAEIKVKRCLKMLIDSSDEENQEQKVREKKDIYSDSDSSAILRQMKQEPLDTSDDEVKNKHLILKNIKSRIVSDTSEDEYNKKKTQIQEKRDLFSDIENTDSLIDTEEKTHLAKVKDEFEHLIKKERRNSKHEEPEINATIFNESITISQSKSETNKKFNNKHAFLENTSDEETQEISKKERKEKKHKKKQKKQKHSISSEESCKLDNNGENMHTENIEKISKHHDKKKDHSKKDRRRDKTKEGREKSKKSKKNKAENKTDGKREGKMENIFGSLSEDSENGSKEEHKLSSFHEEENRQQSAYNSESEREPERKEKEIRDREREEHKRRKEKKRREKERRLQEAAAAAAQAEQASNENSMDFIDMGKQLEANMLRDENLDDSENLIKDASTTVNTDDTFNFTEVNEILEHKKEKEDRKEGKEKKKKRKKSKDDKSKHHHHHHHDKNKIKSPEIKKEILPTEEIKIEVEEIKPQNPSLPTLDESSPINNKNLTPDFSSISPISRETPIISPIPKTPTSKEKKRDKFIPGFGTEIDEKIHESAVKSISDFEPTIKKEEIKEEDSQAESQKAEEKPRVVISQEETEDAVAALLGESFGDGQFHKYTEINNTVDQPSNLVEESIVQDDEEMRQAVQSLSASDLDVKPDTPQSEHELQIDTDTEEQEEISVRYDQSKSPEITSFPQASKPTATSYFRGSTDEKVVIKTTNIGSPPSLTPIKPQPAPVTDMSKSLDKEQKSLPVLPEQKQVSVISQAWSVDKKLEVSSEPSLIKIENKVSTIETHTSATKTTSAPPLRQYPNPPLLKVTETTAFPPLKALSKPDHIGLSPIGENKTSAVPIIQTTMKSPNTSQMHNLPARSPVQVNKSSISIHDSGIPSGKMSSNLMHNRLPITPIMTSKPMQAVILQQSKIPHSLEPPKLVPTSDRLQEKPRMAFQPSSPQYSNFSSNQPRMMVQGNIRHLPPQGLLVPSRQLTPQNYGYLGNVSHSTYNLSPVVKEASPSVVPDKPQIEGALKVCHSLLPGVNLVTSQNSSSTPANVITSSHLILSQSLSVPKEHHPKPPTPILSSKISSASNTKSTKPISPSPKAPNVPSSPSPKPVLPAVSPKSLISSPKLTTTSLPLSVSTSETISDGAVSKLNECETASDSINNLNTLQEAKTSTPSSVITSVSKEIGNVGTTEFKEIKYEKSNEDQPLKLAIEKVTEELNMSLGQEPLQLGVEETPKKEDTKLEETSKDSSDSKETKSVYNSDKENVPLDKFDEEKTETESIISDISKERLSADILTKDDPLDTKEDSDYWSAKEVNIDSVIKTLCSADELSDHSSENGKDEWFEDKPNESLKLEPKENLQKSEKKEEPAMEFKNDESEIQDESVEPEEEKELSPVRGNNRGRGNRGRGRGKTRGCNVERGGIQTRRGKLKELTSSQPVAKRGRAARIRPERKAHKSESEATPTDVYEFRDESDEGNKEQRPRLILTIKSPAVCSANNSQTTAIVKEVTKDGAKEIGKESPKEITQPANKATENKEEFTPPTPTNTRKSRRLQEKDISRSTVDDTIEDVVKNTVQTRSSTNQRRSPRQGGIKPTPQIETPRKSPRGRKPRRGSEAAENSSSEETSKEETKPLPSPSKEIEIKEPEKEPPKAPEPVKEKPHEGLKAAVLRRIKGEMVLNQHEPTNLIDPVTGELIPMRECEEGKYIPLPGSVAQDSITSPVILETPVSETSQTKGSDISKQQSSVIAQPQQITMLQQPKPQTLKAHVLSSQAAQTAVIQQQPIVQTKPVALVVPSATASQISVSKAPMNTVVSKTITSTVVTKAVTPISITKTVTPIIISKTTSSIITKSSSPVVTRSATPMSQHLSINTSLGMGVVTSAHLSPRPSVPLSVASKPMPKQIVKPPVLSPVLSLSNQQKQQLLQVSKQQVINKSHLMSPMVTTQAQMVNTQMAHVKPQTVMKQPVIMGKTPIVKPAHSLHQQQILTGAVPSPPLVKSHSPLGTASRIIQAPSAVGSKGMMEPPKIDVSIGNVILGQRPKLSPQGPQQRLAGMPLPGYEASLGEAVTHFPPGSLRPPDLNPAHYMHATTHVMYQQYLRQQHQLQQLSRSGGIEKVGDGQEGEEAPVTSPPLELRRPGSVGLALTSRGAAVPQILDSPHDRATDSPQVGQVYNVHSSRMHYHPNRYYDQTEPPPAHRPLTSHGSLAALGSDRGLAHMTPMGTPDRPLSGSLSGHTALTERSLGAHSSLPDRPIGGHTSLTAHMGAIGTPDRPISAHIERPLSSHGIMGAGLGAAGNLMGAVARHIGADAPTSQRVLQAATPPHASQVPPQAESLFMLLKQYPCMWQGLLGLKNDQAAVQMYFVSGNDDVAKCCLPKNTDGSTPPLRIFQRMRLEPPQVEGVAKKMQMENEHCMLLALPCGHDHMDVLKQSRNLTTGFITYLQQKQAAGIVNVAAPGTTQPPAYVVHIFPTCDFVNENLRRIAPSLLERVADIAHLLIVITTV